MSEHYHSLPHSTQEALLQDTLFDEAMMSDMAEQVGSLSEAYRQLGTTQPIPIESIPNPNVDQHPGAALDLMVRADAVEGIFAGISHRNRAHGAHVARQMSGSSFNRQFKRPDETLSEMIVGTERSQAELKRHIATLNATDAMLEVGFDKDTVNFTSNRLEDRVAGYEKSGKRNVLLRNKVAENIRAIALRQEQFKDK